VEVLAVDPVRRRELADRLHGERLELQPRDACRRREPADHDSQRVRGRELVVPVGKEDERGRRLRSASEQAEQVERRLVRPVHVLQEEHRRPRAQLVEQRGEHVVRPRAARDEPGERLADLGRDVGDRPERAGREERVARTLQHAHVRRALGAKAPDERRLSDTRLAGDEEHAARAGTGSGQPGAQRVEERFALEEGLSVPAASGLRRDDRQASSSRPSAPAAATASPRVRASSFRKIAET